jgi:CheY-like chemotaxis protein
MSGLHKHYLQRTAKVFMPPPNAQGDEAPIVLVVDDDPTISTFLKVVLPPDGFSVLVASSGAEAIEVFRQARKPVAAVLLDVRMPGMDGPQTLAALRRMNPDIRCCFMSGETGEYSSKELCDQAGSSVISKPFQLPELVRVLRGLTA